MANSQEVSVWGIHAGKTGDAQSIFLKENCVALGWPEMGNLKDLGADREAFKEKLIKFFPDRKPGYYPNAAGQLYRFAHEMQKGDIVIYPSKVDKQIHIGEITGDYKFSAEHAKTYPQQRAVKWLKTLPRTQFSQGALYESGSAMSFFLIKNFANEFLSALEGKESIIPPTQDESISGVSESIEQNTRDFITKTLVTELKGHGLAHFVGHLLVIMGYKTRIAPEGPDGGVDIIAHKDELGFVPPVVKVQVKSSEGKIGEPTVSQLYGKVSAQEYGLFVSLGEFTTQAENFARNKSNLRLIDGEELVNLVLAHYDNLDSKYKALLPLKRVYVPEAIEEAE